ncbi:MAG: HAMP domain-containing histidine kinase [Flavobacteriales bacterium]|nr:HAMP domain-containing histidine kinase [Flavobacteriales bacterium]
MKRSTINIVIILAIISLGGVIITQIYWVGRAYNLQEKQFNDRVVIAMTEVVDRIQTMNEDSAIVEPVEQMSSNFFVANINDTLHPYLLETLLKDEFVSSNLEIDFEYGIYDCFNDSIVFGGKVDFGDEQIIAKPEDISIQKKFDRDGHYFGILFPRKSTLVIAQMDFWIFSSIMILLVVLFFSYTIFLLLRQKRLSEVKNDFINNMTHELKTPISTISLSAEVLLQDGIANDPERLNQYAQIVYNENNRLKTQVDKVLQIATLSPENVNLKLEPLDLNAIVSSACDTFKVRVDEQNGSLRLERSSEEAILLGDRVHITNIVYNLLDNACKYTDDEPHIQVTLALEGKHLELTVADRGLGISPEHQRMIFDKFFRVPTGNIHNVKGFGLGLFYVKTMVEAHGGKIAVKSEQGKGSTFTIRFKRHD